MERQKIEIIMEPGFIFFYILGLSGARFTAWVRYCFWVDVWGSKHEVQRDMRFKQNSTFSGETMDIE